MFSVAAAPVWSHMVDLHATWLLVLLVPLAHARLGGAAGVRVALCLLLLASTALRYHLVHALTVGTGSCPWHAYIRAYTPEPLFSQVRAPSMTARGMDGPEDERTDLPGRERG